MGSATASGRLADVHSVELALELIGTSSGFVENHLTPVRGTSGRLGSSHTEVGEDAVNIACSDVDPLFEIAERGRCLRRSCRVTARRGRACGSLLVRRRCDVSLMGDGSASPAATRGTICVGFIGLVADRSPVSADARCSSLLAAQHR